MISLLAKISNSSLRLVLSKHEDVIPYSKKEAKSIGVWLMLEIVSDNNQLN